MVNPTERVIEHLGQIDPTMLEGVVDTSPSLESWASVRPTLADMDFVMTTMAAAYDAAVYSVGRHARGDVAILDLPIGAAVGDPEGSYYQGFANDKESGDPDRHAEVMAMDHAEEMGVTLGGLTLSTTVEPCPSCLGHIEDRGISRVVYGASRKELEVIGIVKPHGLKAPELVKRERILSGGYSFEFFQIPNRAVQVSCMELFVPYQRNPQTEVVVFDRSRVGSTRFSSFAHEMDETPREGMEQPPEKAKLVNRFSDVLAGFYKK